MITLDQAKKLSVGSIIYESHNRRLKITSIKTWKTRPNDVEIHCKFGLYRYPVYNQDELDQLSFDR